MDVAEIIICYHASLPTVWTAAVISGPVLETTSSFRSQVLLISLATLREYGSSEKNDKRLLTFVRPDRDHCEIEKVSSVVDDQSMPADIASINPW